MLSGLLGARQVIDYLYGEMRETQHLRERLPSALEWEVSRAVEEILSHPCKMVMKAQSQHAHWLLPDAIASVLKLHITLQQILDTPVVRQHDEEEEERVMRVDIKDLQDCMCRSILKDTNYLLAPVREFIPARGHEVMALLLDPRFCRGNFFLDAAPPAPDDRDRKRSAKALMRQYNDEVLKPTLAQLSKFIRQEQQEEAARGGHEHASAFERALCDEDSDDEGVGGEGEGADGDEEYRLWAQHLMSRIEEELKAFRSTALPDPDHTVLQWWREHKADFPLLAELARMVLAVPASQIECERVFSAAGLLTQHLRNRMGVENMSIQVFLLKNMDVEAEIRSILESTYSAGVYQASLATDIKILSELSEARLKLSDLEKAPADTATQNEVEYELELSAATENMILEFDE